jgi:hypothetical protein
VPEEIQAVDEFDQYLSQVPEEPRVERLRRRMQERVGRELVLSKEVARALVAGMPLREISETIGVPMNTLRQWKDSLGMATLLEVETHRVLRHLSKRDLGKEKYLGLATAVGGFIDKIRLLREQATIIQRTEGDDSIGQLRVALFGFRQPGTSEGTSQQPALDVTTGTREIPQEIESRTAIATNESNVGSGEV